MTRTKQPKKFSFSPTSSSSAMRMTGQYCLPFEDTYGARNLNWPLLRKDYQYGFRVWCRGYSKGDSSEDEDFTFQVSPKEKEGESSSQTIDSWRNKDQASSVPLGQPETEGFRSHPSRPSSPLSRAQETQATSEEREREEGSPSVPEPSKNSSWWESFLCLCRGPKTKEDTPSGNEGNGRDTDTGSGGNDPGE